MSANVTRARLAAGERTRLQVVAAVKGGATTYAELDGALDVSLDTIKRHLTNSGLNRKEARERLVGVS